MLMRSKMNFYCGLHAILLHIMVVASYQDFDCPDKCQPCLKEAVVCTGPGRTTLPERISSTVERLTVVNQRFSQTSLSSDNFTQFAPPHISLKQLIIRHCNVEHIEPQTFSALTKLESMDLSSNDNLKISSDAFSGLKLRYLQMNNMDLKLGPHVFRGLVVTSLSLNSCSLMSIDYETLHPLGRTLSKLFLNNNRLKVLEPKLQLIFQRLDSLDLTGNPFDCNCDMKWLINIFRQNQENPDFNNKRLNSNYNIIPRCLSPDHMRNRYMVEVNDTEIICDSPQISEVDIKLSSLTNARLICSGYQSAWKAPMQISWYSTVPGNGYLGSDIFINNSVSSKEVPIKHLKEVGQYNCVINNTMGRVTASVRINWPDISQNYATVDDEDFLPNSSKNLRSSKKSWSSIFFERRFTLLEILAAITGTILITGLIFIIIHRFILIKCVLVKRKNKKISSQPSNLATVSLTTSYEPGIYSNSQTYDLPGAGYGGSNLQIATPISTPQQFLDFKTQRKIYRKL